MQSNLLETYALFKASTNSNRYLKKIFYSALETSIREKILVEPDFLNNVDSLECYLSYILLVFLFEVQPMVQNLLYYLFYTQNLDFIIEETHNGIPNNYEEISLLSFLYSRKYYQGIFYGDFIIFDFKKKSNYYLTLDFCQYLKNFKNLIREPIEDLLFWDDKDFYISYPVISNKIVSNDSYKIRLTSTIRDENLKSLINKSIIPILSKISSQFLSVLEINENIIQFAKKSNPKQACLNYIEIFLKRMQQDKDKCLLKLDIRDCSDSVDHSALDIILKNIFPENLYRAIMFLCTKNNIQFKDE